MTGLGDAIAVVFLPLILEMELENGVLRGKLKQEETPQCQAP